MAYAQHLENVVGKDLAFCAYIPLWRRYARLPGPTAKEMLAAIAENWENGSCAKSALVSTLRARPYVPLLARITAAIREDAVRQDTQSQARRVVLKVSPDHLHSARALTALLHHERAALAVMVHDLLPIDFPEYCGPGAARRHRQRLGTAAQLASHIIANSHNTARSLARHFTGRAHPPITAVPLGIEPAPGTDRIFGSIANPDRHPPYFVCIGTIEPRKNHLLLLHIWRRLAEYDRGENHGDAPSAGAVVGGRLVPKLYIVGRRGWENENVIDLLERSPSIRAHVVETGPLGDVEIAGLLKGARALLAPSFAEGFDLPVAEALASGIPVICSDIAVHREIGAAGPDYAPPLDGPRWQCLIEDYARPHSTLRERQLRRLGDWRIAAWHDHMCKVLQICNDLVPRNNVNT